MLDKFNRWYVDAIPEPDAGMQWNEPIAASRSRARQHRRKHALLAILYISVAMAVLLIRRDASTLTVAGTLLPVIGVTILFLLSYWLWSFVPTIVTIAPNFVRIVQGRTVKTYRFKGPVYAHIEDAKHRALVFTTTNHKSLKVFHDPEREPEIVEFVTKLGFLRDANAQDPSAAPTPPLRAPRL